MQRKDWTLLAICAGGGQGLSPVQLQKSLFLFGEKMPEASAGSFYDFEPYHFGPFDDDVYRDAERLQREGLVAISRKDGQSWNQYVATADGCDRARDIEKQNPRAASYLRSIVSWARQLSFSELVRAIYEQYPSMKANSVFNG